MSDTPMQWDGDPRELAFCSSVEMYGERLVREPGELHYLWVNRAIAWAETMHKKYAAVQLNDTPRTDAASLAAHGMPEGTGPWRYVESNFARQLERELTAANERIKELESQWDGWPALQKEWYGGDYASMQPMEAIRARIVDDMDRIARLEELGDAMWRKAHPFVVRSVCLDGDYEEETPIEKVDPSFQIHSEEPPTAGEITALMEAVDAWYKEVRL